MVLQCGNTVGITLNGGGITLNSGSIRCDIGGVITNRSGVLRNLRGVGIHFLIHRKQLAAVHCVFAARSHLAVCHVFHHRITRIDTRFGHTRTAGNGQTVVGQ